MGGARRPHAHPRGLRIDGRRRGRHRPRPPTAPSMHSMPPTRRWPAGSSSAWSSPETARRTPAAGRSSASCSRPAATDDGWTKCSMRSSTPGSSRWTRPASRSPTRPSSASGLACRSGSTRIATRCESSATSPSAATAWDAAGPGRQRALPRRLASRPPSTGSPPILRSLALERRFLDESRAAEEHTAATAGPHQPAAPATAHDHRHHPRRRAARRRRRLRAGPTGERLARPGRGVADRRSVAVAHRAPARRRPAARGRGLPAPR